MIKIYIGLIAVATIWGVNFGISRWAMDFFDPELFVFLRYGLALPIFFIVLKLKEGSIGIELRDVGRLLLLGLLGITVLEIAVMYSIKYTTLANASLLNVAPWPIFVALFAPLFTKESITSRLVLGGSIAMIGVILIILGGNEGLDLSREHIVGNLLAFGVSIVGALFNLMCMPLMKRYSVIRLSSWFILFGVLFIFPFTLGSWGKVAWASFGVPIWSAIFYNVIFCTFFAFIVWNYCMKIAGATRSNFFRYAVPAAAVFAGYVLYRETITLWQIIGALIIAAGLIWISLEKTRVEPQPKQAATESV